MGVVIHFLVPGTKQVTENQLKKAKVYSGSRPGVKQFIWARKAGRQEGEVAGPQ